MMTELLLLLTFLKPVVDTFRVASGAEKDPLSTFDPLTEMIIAKGAELAGEVSQAVYSKFMLT